MRLKSEWVQKMISVFQDVKLKEAQLFLFGSRLDDHRKGGDIDLLLVTSVTEKSRLAHDVGKLLIRLRAAADDQKVDLVLATQEDLSLSKFLRTIENKVLLKEFA